MTKEQKIEELQDKLDALQDEQIEIVRNRGVGSQQEISNKLSQNIVEAQLVALRWEFNDDKSLKPALKLAGKLALAARLVGKLALAARLVVESNAIDVSYKILQMQIALDNYDDKLIRMTDKNNNSSLPELDFILNDCLNKALCGENRIKGIPDSNKIAKFVSEYLGFNNYEKAEEYLKEFSKERGSLTLGNYTYIGVKYEDAYYAIQQALIDAIDTAVEMCADDVYMLYHDGHFKKDTPMNHVQVGSDNVQINKQSILQVADKLKDKIL